MIAKRLRRNKALVVLYILVIILIIFNAWPFLSKISEVVKPSLESKKTYKIVVDTSTEFINAYKEVLPSVVSIKSEESFGSGVIFSEDGLIVTNDHVLRNATDIKVIIDGNKIYPSEVIGRDPETDIAVIKINASNLKPAKLGDSDKLMVGEKVVAIGNPFGFDFTVTSGIISAKHRDFGPTRYKDFLQTDASINPGNSGGPLVNIKGEVIGINTFILGRSEGLGFAIPINLVKPVYNDLLDYGKVRRGFFGVLVKDYSDVDENGVVHLSKGTYIVEVLNESAAEKAGIKQGDVIIKVNDVEVKNSNEFRNLVAKLPSGKEARLEVLRDEKVISLDIVVGEKPEEKP